MDAPNESDLKEECQQLMRRVAHKRSTYPQSCAKYVAKALQRKIDPLVTAAMKASTPADSEDEDWRITDQANEDYHIKCEKLASLQCFNKIYDNIQETKGILEVLKQICNESSCEVDLITNMRQ